jgi:hypothetical protein
MAPPIFPMRGIGGPKSAEPSFSWLAPHADFDRFPARAGRRIGFVLCQPRVELRPLRLGQRNLLWAAMMLSQISSTKRIRSVTLSWSIPSDFMVVDMGELLISDGRGD